MLEYIIRFDFSNGKYNVLHREDMKIVSTHDTHAEAVTEFNYLNNHTIEVLPID